jgi:hypothetical protein
MHTANSMINIALLRWRWRWPHVLAVQLSWGRLWCGTSGTPWREGADAREVRLALWG